MVAGALRAETPTGRAERRCGIDVGSPLDEHATKLAGVLGRMSSYESDMISVGPSSVPSVLRTAGSNEDHPP